MRVLTGVLLAACLAMPLAAAELNSTWTTDYGEMSLTVDDEQKVSGTYPEFEGRILGQLTGNEIQATWIQATSEKRCDRPLLGSFHWGIVQWKLQPNGAMSGTWSYCSNPLGSDGAWNGTLVSGQMPTVSTAAIPPAVPQPGRAVTDTDVRTLFERYVGPAEGIGKSQQLTGDFTCDGVDDRVLGYLDTSVPERPQYVVLFVTATEAGPDGDAMPLGFGKDPRSLCGNGPDSGVTISPVEGSFTDGETLTGEAVCGKSIRVASKQCTAPQIFWKLNGQPGGRPGDRLSVGKN